MADISEITPHSITETKQYLLLLTSPLDTVESVEELLDIEFEATSSDDTMISTRLEATSDQTLLKSLFGRPGQAVILREEQANRIVEYANRHRAVYAMQMMCLDGPQYREARLSALGVGYPVWVFLSDAQQEAAAAISFSGHRPATLTGFHAVEKDGRTHIQRYRATSNHEAATEGRGGEGDGGGGGGGGGGGSTTVGKEKRRFRPAQDVLSRLRHDPSLDPDDYRVVYEDRFRGELTLNLSQWASDSTDEEFIPQHRILRFERSWDGVAVWDRRRRVDLMFLDGQGQVPAPASPALTPPAAEAAAGVSGTAVQVASSEGLAGLEASLQSSLESTVSGRLQRAFIKFIDDDGAKANGLVYSS